MAIASTDLKNGVTFLYYGKPYQVIKYSLIKMGRGGAVVKVNVRNIETGSVEEKSFSSNVTVDDLTTSKRKLQFLYKDSVNVVFMDPATYEQVEIPLSVIGEQVAYLKEGTEVDILFWDEKPLSVDIAPKVVLTVVETDPGVKGNSATNMFKPAILENGLKVKIPLFINVGEKIRVDTRNGEYVERAK
jgi:elongation factor P